MDKRELLEAIAPCGLDCMDCPVHESNITDELRQRIAALSGKLPEDVACHGCRSDRRAPLCPKDCATLDCSRGKGVDFCFECDQFPCENLHPASDQAQTLPHNLKIYNSCRMEKIGPEKWLNEEAKPSMAKYYKGKMIVGRGPVLEEE